MDNANTANAKKKTDEIKQAFLSSAISDISAYIQLADTKVSIIMAAAVALIVGLFACYEPIGKLIASVKPCSWQGVALLVLAALLAVSIISVFVFGILTIRSHVSKIGLFLNINNNANSLGLYNSEYDHSKIQNKKSIN